MLRIAAFLRYNMCTIEKHMKHILLAVFSLTVARQVKLAAFPRFLELRSHGSGVCLQ